MAKSKDNAQSTKSTKSKSSTKTTASSIVKKAKSGFASLKRKATEVISLKKKKSRIHENSKTQAISLSIICLPQILKDGTEFFSCGTPNLATVIPAMDHIDMTFTNALKPDSSTHPAIHHALILVKKTLNKYYSLTDEAEVYRIAMGKPFKLGKYLAN